MTIENQFLFDLDDSLAGVNDDKEERKDSNTIADSNDDRNDKENSTDPFSTKQFQSNYQDLLEKYSILSKQEFLTLVERYKSDIHQTID